MNVSNIAFLSNFNQFKHRLKPRDYFGVISLTKTTFRKHFKEKFESDLTNNYSSNIIFKLIFSCEVIHKSIIGPDDSCQESLQA